MAISLPPKGNDAKVLGSYFAALKVTAQSIPNMTVAVAEGAFWTADNEHQEYIGGTSPTISAPTADAKWVLVTVTKNGALNIVNGTPSATPVLPDVSTYKDELPLAAIFVGDTVTAITNDMIYDIRPQWQIPPDSVSQSQLNDFATITFVNNGLAAKAETTGTAESEFTLNVGGTSINDAALVIDRFALPDVRIRFNETATSGSPAIITPRWEFTNDGTTYNAIGISAGDFYTKTDLDNGVLDFRYYTTTQFGGISGSGVLDTRYYHQDVADVTFSALGHTHPIGDITGLNAQVETINSIPPVLGDVALGLNELNDVANVSPNISHVLKYNVPNTRYENGLLNTNDLSDVDTATITPIPGDLLVNNGGTFVNRQLLKSDISDFLGTEFMLLTNVAGDAPAGDGPPDSNGVAQDVYGVKTFKDGVVIESSLAVSGSNTTIQTTELKVSDPHIDINFGEAGPGVGGGTGTSGIRVDRGSTGGSPTLPPAIIQWDENAGQWELGIEGSASPVVTGNHNHVVADITDFAGGVTTQLAINDLNAIQDVTYLAAPTGNDHLAWNFTTSQWENKPFSVAVTTELNANNLDQLADVTYLGSPALAAGDFLEWTGSQWVNHVPTKSDISDFVEADYIHTTGNETKTGDFILAGDLTVQGGVGTETRLQSEHVYVSDSVITYNADETGAGVGGGAGTAGIEIERGTNDNAFLLWNDATGTWSISQGSGITVTSSTIEIVGHTHFIADVIDVTATATELNFTTGTTSNIQTQLDDKISRTGDTMDAGANLTFSTTGEVLGLPVVPSVDDAASSKKYVDDQIIIAGGSLAAHVADLTLHITAAQNIFLDGLNINLGSPIVLTAADVNQLQGISGNVQTLLDTKTDKIVPGAVNNIATLDATGNLTDGGILVNDAGTTVSDIWTAAQIDTTKADKIGAPAATNNLAALDGTGNIIDSLVKVDDAGLTTAEIWTANKIDTTKIDKVGGATVGNFAEFDATGNVVDNSTNASTFAAAVHTHVVADVTDFDAGVNTYLTGTAILNDLSDVIVAPIANDILQYNGSNWINSTTLSIFGTDFVRKSGSVAESITGVKTFNDDVVLSGDLTVNGNTTTIASANLVVTDKNITLNSGYSGATIGSDGAGLHVNRNQTFFGSPPVFDLATLIWDDALTKWKGGLLGSEEVFAVEGATASQPLYEIIQAPSGGGSPLIGAAVYNLSFGVPVPAAGKTGIQIFVNGVKQIEGPAKAFLINYTNPSQVVVTFNSGSEPTIGADVEFYGFGYIA